MQLDCSQLPLLSVSISVELIVIQIRLCIVGFSAGATVVNHLDLGGPLGGKNLSNSIELLFCNHQFIDRYRCIDVDCKLICKLYHPISHLLLLKIMMIGGVCWCSCTTYCWRNHRFRSISIVCLFVAIILYHDCFFEQETMIVILKNGKSCSS